MRILSGSQNRFYKYEFVHVRKLGLLSFAGRAFPTRDTSNRNNNGPTPFHLAVLGRSCSAELRSCNSMSPMSGWIRSDKLLTRSEAWNFVAISLPTHLEQLFLWSGQPPNNCSPAPDLMMSLRLMLLQLFCYNGIGWSSKLNTCFSRIQGITALRSLRTSWNRICSAWPNREKRLACVYLEFHQLAWALFFSFQVH